MDCYFLLHVMCVFIHYRYSTHQPKHQALLHVFNYNHDKRWINSPTNIEPYTNKSHHESEYEHVFYRVHMRCVEKCFWSPATSSILQEHLADCPPWCCARVSCVQTEFIGGLMWTKAHPLLVDARGWKLSEVLQHKLQIDAVESTNVCRWHPFKTCGTCKPALCIA